MLLVLAILVALGAIVTPNLIQSFKRQTLKKSGDLVRAEWARARTEAMNSGRVQIFRCVMGGNQFRTDTWVSASDAFGIGSATSTSPIAPTGLDSGAEGFRELPQGVAFYAAETLAESRDLATEQEVGGSAGGTYERRIYFYPDGTCSTAQLVLFNDREQFVTVDLRGLTGASRVSEIQTRQEVPQR